MKYYDIKLAYDNGISALHMGGKFWDGCFYREKDILENDYSQPTLVGKNKVEDIKDCSISSDVKIFLLTFLNGKLFLTEEEMKAGLIDDVKGVM